MSHEHNCHSVISCHVNEQNSFAVEIINEHFQVLVDKHDLCKGYRIYNVSTVASQQGIFDDEQ